MLDKAKTATKTEFIVDATIIPRMMVTSAFSNRTEFSVWTARLNHWVGLFRMKLFGIAGSIPVAFVASTLYATRRKMSVPWRKVHAELRKSPFAEEIKMRAIHKDVDEGCEISAWLRNWRATGSGSAFGAATGGGAYVFQ